MSDRERVSATPHGRLPFHNPLAEGFWKREPGDGYLAALGAWDRYEWRLIPGSGVQRPSATPLSYAKITACTRPRAPSLASSRATWVFTVLSPMRSSRAISALLSPRASASRWLAKLSVIVRLAGRRPLPVVVVLAVLSPVAAFMVFGLLDEAAQSVVGDAGPAWLRDEAGILAMALVALAAGAAAWRAAPTRRASPASAAPGASRAPGR